MDGKQTQEKNIGVDDRHMIYDTSTVMWLINSCKDKFLMILTILKLGLIVILICIVCIVDGLTNNRHSPSKNWPRSSLEIISHWVYHSGDRYSFKKDGR